nr:putative reverse transcriptase domain-containing protein [Tanacetum cinerariifolium]
MVRECVMDFGGSWDTHLPLVKFSYNNSYHKSIKCAPFEALYGRKCRSPVIWAEVGESRLIRPEIMHETTDKIIQIKEMLKTSRFVGILEEELNLHGSKKINSKPSTRTFLPPHRLLPSSVELWDQSFLRGIDCEIS